MEPSTDVHVKTAKIQKQIEEYVGLGSENLLFEYRKVGDVYHLDLITINPRHMQSFLFHTVSGVDKLDMLTKMLDYAKSYREKENSYTIQWIAKQDKELHTSYFRAKNMYDALDKLYYGREINAITVFSVVLNPVS